jgi:YVTN family beta-propeller protein
MRLRLEVARIRRPGQLRLFGVLVSLVAALGIAAFGPVAAGAASGYVVVSGDNEIVPLGGGSPIAVGENPEAIAVTPDGSTAYVENRRSGTVTPVDVATGTASVPIRVASPEESTFINFPGSSIAITPDGSRAYVLTSSVLTLIDLATGAALTPIQVPASAAAVAITPDGMTAYVADEADNTVVPIDLPTGGKGSPIPVGTSPVSIAITPDGRTAYVVDGSTVTPIDLMTDTPEAPILTGAQELTDVVIAPDGRTAYVTGTQDHVIPIDVASNTAGSPITLLPCTPEELPLVSSCGEVPYGGIAITPDGQTAYVMERCGGETHCLGGELYSVDLATRQVSPVMQFGIFSYTVDPSAVVMVLGPSASLSVTAAPAGQASSFNATATNPGGSVSGYAWSFGDGTTAVGSSTVSHVYANSGAYTVTLSTTNQGGCATAEVFTGQTAYCNGLQTVHASRVVDVAGPPAASIMSPRARERFPIGQTVATTFACAESPYGPGLKSCQDSNGNLSPHGRLDTSTAGSHQYSVIARSIDGLSATASIHYTVTARPVITILTRRALAANGRAMITLACSRTRWQQTGCRGTLTLTRTVYGNRHQALTLVLARIGYNVRIGARRTFSLRLNQHALALLDRARNHRLAAGARATLAGGHTTTRSLSIAL